MCPLLVYDWKAARIFLAESIVMQTDSCIEWPYKRLPSGYGKINVGKNDERLVHKYVYELVHKVDSSGLDVCHKCDNPPCFNPRHLFLGTRLDNVADCIAKGRAKFANKPPKLTPEQVLEIRATFVKKAKGKRGPGLKAFADKYCVSMGNIAAIVERRSWKDLK